MPKGIGNKGSPVRRAAQEEDRVAPNLQTIAYPKGAEGRHPSALAAR